MIFLSNLKRDVGRGYVRSVVSQFFVWMKREAPHCLQTDALLHPNNSDSQSQARNAVKEAFFQLLEMLVGSVVFLPPLLKTCCRMVWEGVLEEYGEESAREFLVGFYLSQLICPALTVPSASLDLADSQLGSFMARFLLFTSQSPQSSQPSPPSSQPSQPPQPPQPQPPQSLLPDHLQFATEFVVEARTKLNHFLSLLVAK